MKPPRNDLPKTNAPVEDRIDADNVRREQHFRDCLEDDDVAEVLDRLHQTPKSCQR